MDVVSPGPLPVSSLLWQPRAGLWTLTVVCKATFQLRPIESPLAPAQDALNDDDNYWNDDPSRSVYSPGDLAPLKQRADIVLVGSAFAPGNQPVRSLVARLVVGEVDKSIEVWCERVFTQGGQLHEGPRFQKMAMRYERAAGGPETENPVGMRQDASPDVYGAVPIPNLTPPGLMISQRSDHVAPIGFGPIAPSWPRRRERLGRHAGSWPGHDWAEHPVPEEIDRSFFNVAPRDQQVDAIRADERIVLENLHAEHARLVTALPGIRPRAGIERRGAPTTELPMTADTLWIDTNRGVCTVTWRGQVRLADRDEPGRVVIAVEHAGRPLSSMPAPDESDVVQTMVPFLMPKPSMPFLPGPAEASPMARPRAAASTMRLDVPHAGEPEEISVDDDMMISAADENALHVPTLFLSHPVSAAAAGGALPFAAPASAPAPVAPPPMNIAPPQPPIWDPPARPVPPAAPSSPWAGSSPASPSLGERPNAALAPLPDVASFARPGAQGGNALDASNAAAGREAAAPRVAEAPAPATPAPEPRAKALTKEMVRLLWFDPDCVSRIRKHKSWRRIITEMDLDPSAEADDDDAEPTAKQQERRDRRHVLRVLVRGKAIDAPGLKEELMNALSEDGELEPPLVLVTGDLHFPFDEIETLKATVTAVRPLIAGDKRLKEVIDTVDELLATPWLSGSGRVADGLTERVKEAFWQGKRTLPPDYLESHTERILLEARHFQKRTVFGEVWLRSLMVPGGAGEGVPAYLPERLAKELPMFRRMRARVLAEVEMQQDQYESCPIALKVVGVGRMMGGLSARL
jgi:hypothetical protein